MSALELLKEHKRWVLIGDANNEEKYANKIYKKLIQYDYEVFKVFKKPGEDILQNLDSIRGEYCIDLCINPADGIKYVKDAKELGVKDIVMQPGAESIEIINFCKENGINCVKGCVLRELNNMK